MGGGSGVEGRRWEAAVLADVGKAARRAPRPRGRGGTRVRTCLGGAERGNPVTVRQERPPAGRQQRGSPGGYRTAKKRTAAAERQQEVRRFTRRWIAPAEGGGLGGGDLRDAHPT